MVKISKNIEVPLKEIDFSFVKGTGPGGQKINKTSSTAILKWNIEKNKTIPLEIKKRIITKLEKRINKDGEIIIRSGRFRAQEKNIADCLIKLQNLLSKASHKPKKRIKTTPTKSSIEKRLKEKKKRAEKKDLRKKVY